ncbi:MAG: arginase family protein [Pseudomonadota bacterium]|nr:arginase family protein [Pseudomonadota bacterium]
MDTPPWEGMGGYTGIDSETLPMIDAQTPTFMGVPLACNPAALAGADVAIIGAPYVAGSAGKYAGVDKTEWVLAPQRVRQQSARYPTGYIQELDIDIFEHLRVVDMGDAEISPDVNTNPTAENILKAQAAVELLVNQALDAGSIPVVIGQNSPCGSYAIAKPIAERNKGKVGMISTDTHWDSRPLDYLTGDSRIAGSGNWKSKTYNAHQNFSVPNLVEIGERGMLERAEIVRGYRDRGAHFYPRGRVRGELGIDGLCRELKHAYDGTDDVYVHFDMDILGGAGPAPGDILGELAEPMGMSDYEIIRLAHEIGLRGLTGMSFICIPPGSMVIYRTIVYIIAFLIAGIAISRQV